MALALLVYGVVIGRAVEIGGALELPPVGANAFHVFGCSSEDGQDSMVGVRVADVMWGAVQPSTMPVDPEPPDLVTQDQLRTLATALGAPPDARMGWWLSNC